MIANKTSPFYRVTQADNRLHLFDFIQTLSLAYRASDRKDTMTRHTNFVEAFWEKDFIGTQGYERLLKRIQDGRKVCKDVEQFLKLRGKADQQYSKALQSLSKSADGREETGGLGAGWQDLKVQTDRIAQYHEESGNEYIKMAESVSKFAEEQRQLSKQYEDKMRETHKAKKNLFNKMVDWQKTYHAKCRDLVQQEEQLKVSENNVSTTTSKDIDKLKTKLEKCREAMEQADQSYRAALENLERVRQYWENDMEVVCTVFQDIEESRIFFLRDLLWRCTNVDSRTCVELDESCEHVRLVLEKCDIATDIQDFIAKNQTGSSRPERINYEDYFEGQKSPLAAQSSLTSKDIVKGVLIPPGSRFLPLLPPRT
ncbi:hypothetical protein ACJMK2_012816 [Sinanodonta woodiana]|uniref:F-BAR domain-containing protein n=1 Tax=Sinanodonta woodiana TaxID=1069815 RepID=A0ABD3VBS7_SINWO